MYSWILRFLYSLTYYVHIGLLGEVYQISKKGLLPEFEAGQTKFDNVIGVIGIHYPLLFVVFCVIFAQFMVMKVKKIAGYTTQMKSSESYGIEIIYTGIQILPYFTFAFREHLFGFVGALVLLIVTVFFLVAHGTYNLTLAMLGYKQYKVKTDNSTFWLVSKRKISNFSNSEFVHTLQDNVYVRHE